MYVTAGAEGWQWKQEGDKKRGEAVAIEASTGKVHWRSNEQFGSSCPVLVGTSLALGDGFPFYGLTVASAVLVTVRLWTWRKQRARA